MKPIRKLLFGICMLALAMLACNVSVNAPAQPAGVPSSAAATTDINAALTLAVATLQAASTPTVPPPAGPPTVTVSSPTNCRTGPSAAYDLVMTLQPGVSAEVVGKDTPDNYWIITVPGGGSQTCWLWGQYATVIGDTSKLPEAVPPPLPPSPTPAPTTQALPPLPPKNVSLSCTSVNTSHKIGQLYIFSAQWTVVVKWKDNTNDAGGFYVYKDGTKLATLGANNDTFTDQFSILSFGVHKYTYGVAAFNQNGSSTTFSVDLTTCP
jgi:uncharacterized protein YgiM (DUF1202 family)